MTSASLLSPPILTSCHEANDITQESALFVADFIEALPVACAIFGNEGYLLRDNIRFRALWAPGHPISHLQDLLARVGMSNTWPATDRVPIECEIQPARCHASVNTALQRFNLSITPLSPTAAAPMYLSCLREVPELQQEMFRQRDLHARLLHTSRSQSVGEMTTILSHELNQPLGSIVNYLDAALRMLANNDQVPGRAKDALRLAQAQAHQAGAVISRIREFVSSRQTQLEFCDVGLLVRNALELSKWDLHKLSIKACLDIAKDLPPVEVDPVLLGQVLTNLVHNAIDAMRGTLPHTRKLDISAFLDLEQRVVVRVCDTGRGVSPDDKLKLFKPFFTTKPKGMGIGLSISRSIMELHAGSLYHEANPQGGSAFCFTLPTYRG